MEIEIAKTELNSYKQRNLNLNESFKNRRDENEILRKDMEDNINDENLMDCASNLASLNDNTKNLIVMMEEMNAITKGLITLVENLLNKLENKNALSEYRDWITFFNMVLQLKLGANVWSVVKFAVYKKIRMETENYADWEKESILQLEAVLKSVNMSLYDYELLILMKIRSNDEFLGDKSPTLEQAEKKLQASFPEEMKFFKEPLQKVFNALVIIEAGIGSINNTIERHYKMFGNVRITSIPGLLSLLTVP
ncbi:1749_t:CDS:2 [Funneliformis caledonium]|uniref:1749_t:CDS:1 n=1 Tax=Funneliformis caledonium TaxID=1117310 RepID=A0A9N8WPN1_9GLOM|nr:1749_t:CDS:2 [Funneliformis caledonium]